MAKILGTLLALGALAAGASAAAARQLINFQSNFDGSAYTSVAISKPDANTLNAIYFAISDNGYPSLTVDTRTVSAAFTNLTNAVGKGEFGDLAVGAQIISQLNSTDVAWQVTLYSIVEYVANTTVVNGAVQNTGFHPATDLKVQEINLNSHAYNGNPFGFQMPFPSNANGNGNGNGNANKVTVTYSPINAAATQLNGANITQYTINGAFSTGGNVKVIARIGANPFTVNGNTVAAGNVKFDVEVHNFPYKRNDSSLAVRMLIASGTATFDFDRAKNTHSLTGSVTKGGFFGWNNTVAADNGTANVVITNTSDWRPFEGQGLFYSFTGTNVASYVWDPELGTAAAATSSASSLAAGSSIVIISLATLASLLL